MARSSVIEWSRATAEDLGDLDRARWEGSLHEFMIEAWKWIDPAEFVDGKHLAVISAYLEAFSKGEIAALLINIPPRHCKSILCSVMFQAWIWTRSPTVTALFTSYAESLAHDHARLFKQLITSTWYQLNWPHVQIAYGHDKVSHYENNHMGKRFSVAINSTMGKGGRFIFFDDPHNIFEAESDDVRDESVRKFNMILSTRGSGGSGGFCCVMQRLHERDYSGDMITRRDDLVHLCLPAKFETDHPNRSTGYRRINGAWVKSDNVISLDEWKSNRGKVLPGDWRSKDGELLWPELFDEKKLAAIINLLEGYGEAGQLQQRPVPRAGGLFKKEWFDEKFIELGQLPNDRIVIRGWDLAASEGKKSPWTVGFRMSYCVRLTRFYFEHVVRERLGPEDVEQLLKRTAKMDGRGVGQDVPQDPGQAGKAQVKALSRTLVGYTMYSSPESGSKTQRADPVASQAKHGNVYIVTGDWNQVFMDEISVFPGSTYRDQADAMSRAFARLLELGGTVSSGVSWGSY